MIDTHAHIYDEAFDIDLEQMLERAMAAGITEIWMPNCNANTIPKMYGIEQINPENYKSMMGLHPCYVDLDYLHQLDIVKAELEKRKFIMIGEIGIDYYWDLKHIELQEQVFLEQIKLASHYDLPICIHSRNSKDNVHNAILKCCELIKNSGLKNIRGIFHCFSGNYEEALDVINLGFHLGIGGVCTFKNGGLDQFLSKIPLEKIVLETDSPYLAPVPHRGKRNESSYLEIVAEKLGDIYGCSSSKIKEISTQNALSIIGK